MNLNLRTLGSFLVGFSLILLFLLTLAKINQDKEGAYLCEVFVENNLDMSKCPAHKNSMSWIIFTSFGIGIIMLAFGIYLLFSPKIAGEPGKKGFKPLDPAKFDADEKRIYDLMKGTDGSAYQTDLIKETGMSKVRITRILDKMESKGVLERKRRGMTNIVVLK